MSLAVTLGNDELRACADAAAGAGQPLAQALAERFGCSADEAQAWLAERCGMTAIDAAELQAMTPVFERLPLLLARQRSVLLLRDRRGRLVGVLADALDGERQALLAAAAAEPLQLRLATPETLEAWLAAHEASSRTTEAVVQGEEGQGDGRRGVEALSLAAIDNAESPAVRLVNSTLYDALRMGASDIHLETVATGLVSKFRIDGVLEAIATVNGSALAEQAISRIKVLAELDIGERRIPQDGSFRVSSGAREIDLRVSVMPSVHGEDAVIRILDKKAVFADGAGLSLQTLGFRPQTLAALRRLAALPYGMMLVTGPTGSGKTTTLYGALSEVNSGREKIVTIEDPVEYQLPGVLQIPVNARKGLTFAKGLRSILRHDPDKIMVGEIRDKETAEIAIQSALTGHLVLSTLHANTVFDVFGRFQHMGVDVHAFASALNGVSAQRLLRLNCRHCAVPAAPAPEALARFGLTPEGTADWNFMQGPGCPECRGSGLRGRRAVAEVLPITPELAEMVVERRPMRQLVDAARRAGVASLQDDALALVREGATTLQEVTRVTLA